MPPTTTAPRVHFPTDGEGKLVAPEPMFDQWDETPHGYFFLNATAVQLADVLLGTHQVDGIGLANQRGVDARRFDLEYVVGPSAQPTARMIVPLDQQVRVKRYLGVGEPRWAWVEMKDDAWGGLPAKPDASLVADHGAATELCCSSGLEDDGTTMCNDCAESWAIDYKVVRHSA